MTGRVVPTTLRLPVTPMPPTPLARATGSPVCANAPRPSAPCWRPDRWISRLGTRGSGCALTCRPSRRVAAMTAGAAGAAGAVIRVLMADDQHLVRGALAALLNLEPDIEVVAEVARGDEVVATALAVRPDVAMLDVEMPGLDGLAAAAALQSQLPSCRVLIVTTFGRAGYLRRAMEGGALGFVVKDAPADRLADAVRRVSRGERVVDPTLAAATLAGGSNPLTGRERDALAAARDGATIADIANLLFLSEGTVRNYLSSSIAKTGTRNRLEALRVADDNGWL